VALELAGIATATVVTVPFASKVRREAEVFGVGDLPLIVIPHLSANDVAIGQMREDDVRAIAARSFPEVLFALTAPREDVAAAYHGTTRARSVL
jgi:hypothetical protein